MSCIPNERRAAQAPAAADTFAVDLPQHSAELFFRCSGLSTSKVITVRAASEDAAAHWNGQSPIAETQEYSSVDGRA